MKKKKLKYFEEKLKAWKEELVHEAGRTVNGMHEEKA
ncbi:MAG: RNA polymerase-binding protein DksA, partial [bacterium]